MALVAVGAWSLFPIAVRVVDVASVEDLSVFIVLLNLAGGVVLAGAFFALFGRTQLSTLWTLVLTEAPARAALLGSSVFRLGYVVCVFYAYKFGPLLEAIVLVELYPIFLVLLAPWLGGGTWMWPERREWVLISMAFVGVAMIIGPSFGDVTFLESPGLLLAIGAGLFNAIDNTLLFRFRSACQTWLVDSGHQRSVAEKDRVRRRDLIAFELLALSLCALIALLPFVFRLRPAVGLPVGTGLWMFYLVLVLPFASALWQYGIYAAGRSNVASLWYLYPVASALLVVVLLGEHPSDAAVFGMAIVVLSNVYLHARRGAGVSLLGARVFLLAAIGVCFLTEPIDVGVTEWRVVEIVGIVYGILSGFVLSRLWARAREQDLDYLEFTGRLRGFMLEAEACAGECRRLFRRTVDLDHRSGRRAIDDAVREVYRAEEGLIREARRDEPGERPGEVEQVLSSLDRWVQSKLAPMTSAEEFALVLLGVLLAAVALVGRAASVLGTVTAVVLSTGVVLVLLACRDLSENKPTRSISRMVARQRFVHRDRQPGAEEWFYVPNDVTSSRWAPASSARLNFYTEESDGELRAVEIPHDPVWLRHLIDAVFYVVCLAVALLLVASG